MCSIRNGILLIVLATGLTGCVTKVTQEYYEPTNTAPLVIDPAMQARDWPRSSSYYSSSAVIAGPTLYPYQPDVTMDEWKQGAYDVPVFFWQTIVSPWTLFKNRNEMTVSYHGARYEPTYTAVPPITVIP